MITKKTLRICISTELQGQFLCLGNYSVGWVFCPLTGYFTLPVDKNCHGATPNILFTGKNFILLHSDEITVSSGNSRHLPLKNKSFFTFNSIFCTKTSKKDPQNLRSLQSSKSLPLLVVIVVPSGIHSSIRARGY